MGKRKKKLPVLPHGMGTFDYVNDDKVRFRKTIKDRHGNSIRKTVVCATAEECMVEMAKIESKINMDAKKLTLEEGLHWWLKNVKKNNLKVQSYDRLEKTVKKISDSRLGHFRYQSISTEEIQEYIDELNKGYCSASDLSKVYHCFTAFYDYVSEKDEFKNPTKLVVFPTKDNILREDKEIVYFDDEDIEKFVSRATAKYKTGKPIYRYGLILAANIFLGLRIGELLALTWGDIDFENRRITVNKTLIEHNLAPGKVEFIIQKSTKTNKIRTVPKNTKARDLLIRHKAICERTEDTDYVIMTKNGKTSTPKNIWDTISAIERKAETKVQYCGGTHVLRHTCASLYFKKNVSLLVIAKILGNSVQVLEDTYIHVFPEVFQEAAEKIYEL